MAGNDYLKAEVGNKAYTQAGVLIIGAGISGMCTAISLLKSNIYNFVIVEKSGGPGGTWRDNRYPGCCCDVHSVLYSYSFEQNPDWSRLYPGQEEMLKYLHGVASKYELYKYIRTNSSVEEARWDERERKWKTHIKVIGSKDAEYGDEYTMTSDFLVSAVGQLNVPHYPNIPGLEDYQGKTMHSARWDWSYDLRGKKVGIIGNGATAAQIVPEIAPEVSHLTIFQRTPNWVVPRYDAAVWKLFRLMFKYFPPLQWKYRAFNMDFREWMYDAVVNPNSKSSNLIREASLKMMKEQLPNKPELWEKLTPTYQPGCKRVIPTDDYFPALARDNVTLETRGIEKITENGIQIKDGEEEEFDMIILATGFRTVEFMHPIKIHGIGGRSIPDIWSKGARALYGVTVDSLPNFAMLYGPNTNLGHNSIILMIEAQTRYILTLITAVLKARRQGQYLTITPNPARMDAYNAYLQKELATTSFADPTCQSWYKTKDGLITNNWSGTVVNYQKLLSRVDWSDFDLEGDGADVLAKMNMYIGRVREENLVGVKGLALSAVSLMAIAAGLSLKAPHLLPRLR